MKAKGYYYFNNLDRYGNVIDGDTIDIRNDSYEVTWRFNRDIDSLIGQTKVRKEKDRLVFDIVLFDDKLPKKLKFGIGIGYLATKTKENETIDIILREVSVVPEHLNKDKRNKLEFEDNERIRSDNEKDGK